MALLSELATGLTFGAQHGLDAGRRFGSLLSSRIDPTALSTVSSALLLGALPTAWYLSKPGPDVIRPSILLRSKIAIGNLLIGTEAGFLALCTLHATTLVDGPVNAAILSLLAACSLRRVLELEHQKTMSSSALLTIWLIISVICDMLRAFAFYHRQNPSRLATAATVLPAVSAGLFKVALLALSEFPKLDLIKDAELRNNTPLDQTTGILSRYVIWPLYNIFLSNLDKDMAITDLADLDKDFTARRRLKAFNETWAIADKQSRDVLALVCGTILAPRIAATAPLRLIRSFFTVAQPILIRRIVQYALGVYSVNSGIPTSLLLIGAAIFIYAGAAISGAILSRAMSSMAVLLRGTLIAAVYQKTLSLTTADAQQHAAMTVITKRVESTVREIALVHNIWATPLELVVCVYILFQTLGNPSFLVALPTVVSHCIGWYIREEIPADRVAWHDKIKDRVTGISGILSETKAVKSIGLDIAIISRLRKLHSIEIASFKSFRKWAIVLEASMQLSKLATYPLVIGSALMVAVWARQLSVVDAFTALATITIMSEPLNSCSTVWSEVKSAATRLHQIQDYLLLKQMHRQRSYPHIPCDLGESGAGNTDNGQATIFELRNGAISIEKFAYPVLERVTAKLKSGDLTMVVGRAGTGKTSLLRSVIGETRITAGYRYKALDHSTAYCGQSAWLRNTSIRHNILGYSAMDADWYNHVLDICLLKPDLRQLPRSDMTLVGSEGNKLTSSQKQRVALARAIYARSSILVLDDIFSSLDDSTASRIGSMLFGPAGIVRRFKMTAILVTHSRHMLRFASRFWLFDVDGRVVDQSGPADNAFRQKLQIILASIASDEDALSGSDASEADISEVADNLDMQEIVSQNEKSDAKERSSWETLMFYVQSFEYPQLLLWLILATIIALYEVFPVLYISYWLNAQAETEMTAWLSVYVALAVSGAVATGWSLYTWWMKLVPNSIDFIHDRMLETTMDATFNSLCSVDLRATLTLFVQDLFSLSSILPGDFYLALHYILAVCIQCAVMMWFSGLHSIFAAPVIITTLVIIQFYYTSMSRQLRYLELESQGHFQSHLTDTENGLEHIRAFGWEVQNLKSALRLIDASQKPFYYSHGARNWLCFALDAVNMCTGVLLTTQMVSHLQTIPASGPAISLTTLISLGASVPSLICSWASLQSSLGSLDRIKTFIETTPREFGLPIQSNHGVAQEWPENGRVVMRNVSAKYQDSDNEPTVLQNISLMLPPGRRIGIVGGPGSGKTTFTRAILNFLEHSGDIIIDGVNIATVPHSILRSRITTVVQDNIKFNESVRYNLCPWTMSVSKTEGNVHDDSIILIMETLNLWGLIVEKGGLDAPFKDLSLSPGQRKLICIGRACLHKLSTRTRLVIMDRPMDGLDNADKQLALTAMEAAFFDCTIIEVANCAEDIPEAHLILHMEHGRIVKKELPNEGQPDPQPEPSVPPTMPTAPVPMNGVFQRILDRSLAAEREVNRQLQEQAASGSAPH